METDVRANPGLLKLDLYCKGMRIDDSCLVERDGGRQILRTRAGLGSGLELILPAGLWTNVPVTEAFAEKSPYFLKQEHGEYWVYRDDGEKISPVTLSPRPAWYDRETTSGRAMTRIGTLQGTYLGIYQAKVCEYWTEKPRSNCKFCSVGLNLGVDDEPDQKSIDDVMEVVWAAIQESNITYVDFNTGHHSDHGFLDILEPYIKEIKRQTGLLIGIQTPPHPDFSRYDRLKAMGANRVSFCFEIFDRERFVEVCPGKDREYGLDRYLAAVEYCAKLKKKGSFEPWVSNGEIVAGLESPESSMAAIDWITEHGGIPTVCVFRPLIGTDYEDVKPPKTEEMIPVFRRLYEACMDNDLPIGIAPNIHVSLVLLPEECRWFVDKPRRFALKEMKRAALSKLYAEQFRRETGKIQAQHRPASMVH